MLGLPAKYFRMGSERTDHRDLRRGAASRCGPHMLLMEIRLRRRDLQRLGFSGNFSKSESATTESSE